MAPIAVKVQPGYRWNEDSPVQEHEKLALHEATMDPQEPGKLRKPITPAEVDELSGKLLERKDDTVGNGTDAVATGVVKAELRRRGKTKPDPWVTDTENAAAIKAFQVLIKTSLLMMTVITTC